MQVITMQVQRTETIESLQIVADGDRLTSRAGTALLAGLADQVGLTRAFSQAMVVRKRRSRHDPGRTLRDLAVMLADGGDRLERGEGTRGVAQAPDGAHTHDRVALDGEEARLDEPARRGEVEQLAASDSAGLREPARIEGQAMLVRQPLELREKLRLLPGLVGQHRPPQRRERLARHHAAEDHIPAHQLPRDALARDAD